MFTSIVTAIKIFVITMLSLTGVFNIGFTDYDKPIDPVNGGDPFIAEDNGSFYYVYTTGWGVTINKIAGLDDATVLDRKTVFVQGSNGVRSDIWAPELHKIGDRWYIITCAVFDNSVFPEANPAVTAPEEGGHYSFVLESKTEDIFGEYEFKGVLAPDGRCAIDATYLQANGKLYFVSSTYRDNAQHLTICEMENPYTLKTDENGKNNAVFLSSPDLTWERKGWLVNEGPAVLYHEDNIHIVYSASGFSSGDYCMGMLTLTGDDILDAGSWSKSILPVHHHLPQADIYSAGHCSFFYRADGEIFMVYHANVTKEFSDRLTFVKPVRFIGDVPVF